MQTSTDAAPASGGNTADLTAVAADAGLITEQIQQVIAGTAGLAAAVSEIAECANDAADLGRTAVTAATSADTTIHRLADASTEIDNVVRLITAIARQTKLLALNAAIEAARANESGSGFTVVAGEVKNLAQETAQAAEAASQHIAAIQEQSGHALSAITEIGKSIKQVNDYQHAIAASVQEQITAADDVTSRTESIARAACDIATTIAAATPSGRPPSPASPDRAAVHEP